MNSFETDVKRAIISKGFLAGFVLELLIFWKVGGDSELFRVTVPVISTFPYATAWLADYQSGYIKAYLPRCGRTSYICGKFLACGIAGGLVEMLPCLLYLRFAKNAAKIKSVAYFLLSDGVGAAFRDTCGNLEQPLYRVWRKLRHLLYSGNPA